MYAVFEKVLLTDKGKALVRQHSAHFDAQGVYRDICAYAKSSTWAAIEASNLLTYITSTRFGDGTWKGTAHGYILHWQDQIRQYEQIIPATGHFPNSIKRAMLENAVGSNQELRAVKSQAAQHKAQNGGIDLTYGQYCTLLLSAAQEFDGSLTRSVKPATAAARRSVYNMEFHDDNQDFLEADHNIDSYCNDVVEVNAAFGFRGPSLTGDQWACLPKDAQVKWDEFSREHKAIILEPKPRPPSGNSNRPPFKQDFGKPSGGRFTPPFKPPDPSLNYHEMSAYDYLVKSHNMSSGQATNTEDQVNEIPPEPDPLPSTLFAHMAQKKDIPPGDITRVLSQTMAKASNSTSKKTIVKDGVTYTANAHVQYRVSSHRHVCKGALVDRGTNGSNHQPNRKTS